MDQYVKGKELARAAVETDTRGDFLKALGLYKEACAALLESARIEPSQCGTPELRQTIQAYLDRIEQISVITSPPKTGSEAPKKSTTDKNTPNKDSTKANLLDEVFRQSAKAQRLEGERKYRLARDAYARIVELLNTFIKYEDDPSIIEMTTEKRDMYMTRALTINNKIKEVGAGPLDSSSAAAADMLVGLNIPSSNPSHDRNNSTSPASPPMRHTVPSKGKLMKAATTQHNAFLPKELELLSASKINGLVYSFWDDPKNGWPSEDVSNGGAVYAEPLLRLSKKQTSHGAEYLRPVQYLEGLQQGTPTIVGEASPDCITQSLVGDCSFVCSLCVCANYEQRFHTKLITRAIYPQDADGFPIYNPSGKYAVKMMLNGAVRKVTVDDRLPVTRKTVGNRLSVSLACSHSTDLQELWISLYEKAYLKVNGGTYDFPGSNSGADLYSLCGWIPEVVHLNDKIDRNVEWNRLYKAHEAGECIMTICTADEKTMDPTWETKLGLVSGHAYAVLEVKEVLGHRLCLVKNPWLHQRWLGRFSHQDRRNWSPELIKALNWDQMGDYKTDKGMFWIDWNDVNAFFARCHISWNPYNFTHRFAVHDFWDKKGIPEGNSYTRNPQFHLTFTTKAPTQVWLLISKHLSNSKEEWPFIALHVIDNKKAFLDVEHSPCTCDGHNGSCKGRHLYTHHPDAHVHTGIYRNTPQVLCRLDDLQPGYHDYTIVASSLDTASMAFSITAYTTIPTLKMHALPASLYKEQGWCLGNFEPPSALEYKLYSDNLTSLLCPQYKLQITKPIPILARAESGANVVLDLALYKWPVTGESLQSPSWQGRVDNTTNGSRVCHIMGKSFACLETETLQPGIYTLAVRNTQALQAKEKFVLRLECADTNAASWSEWKGPGPLIPLEGTGTGIQYQVFEKGWTQECGGSSRLDTNPAFSLKASTQVRVSFRLRHFKGTGSSAKYPPIALHVSTDVNCTNVLASSGKYHAYGSGAVINHFLIQSGQTIFVIASYWSQTPKDGFAGKFALQLWSTGHVEVKSA